jgi:hypothetical protein
MVFPPLSWFTGSRLKEVRYGYKNAEEIEGHTEVNIQLLVPNAPNIDYKQRAVAD